MTRMTVGRIENRKPEHCAAGLQTRRAGWLHVAANALAILALLPLAAAVVGSLKAGGTGGYAWWWGSARGWEALGRTLAVAAPAGAIATLLAWVLVESASRLTRRWASLAVLAACLPLLVPSSLAATAWIVALGREGVITLWLRGTVGESGINLYSVAGAAWVTALRYFGIAALVLFLARRRREGLWPAERVFAVPRAAAAVHLHLRAAVRPLVAAWLLVALFSMNDHIIPGMLLVSTYGTQVLIRYSALLDPAGAAALAAPMAAVGCVLLAAAVRAGRDFLGASAEAAGRQPRSPAAQAFAALVAAGVLALALVVPVAVLAGRTESVQAVAGAIADARDQAWNTLRAAVLGGAISAAVAAILAAQWVRCRRAGVWSAAPWVLLNLTVPPSLLGIGVIELFQHGPLAAARDTSAPLVLGFVVRFLPVATLLLYSLWRSEPAEAALAARVHGVPAWRTAWSIVWPVRRPALAGAAILGAILIATDLETAILLAPPGGATLGVRLYTLIHTAPDAMVSALALGILAVTAPAIALAAGVIALARPGKAGRQP
jgi:ABC-type Fe3+ transport system permease subunit